MSNKVTKKQLKGQIMCDQSYWYRLIDKHWPRWRRRISVVEIIQKGLELNGVLYRDLHCLAKCLDAERMERLVPLSTLPPYDTIKRYLWGDANAHS